MAKITNSRDLALAAARRPVPLSNIGKNLSGVVKRWQDCGWARVLHEDTGAVFTLTAKGKA